MQLFAVHQEEAFRRRNRGVQPGTAAGPSEPSRSLAEAVADVRHGRQHHDRRSADASSAVAGLHIPGAIDSRPHHGPSRGGQRNCGSRASGGAPGSRCGSHSSVGGSFAAAGRCKHSALPDALDPGPGRDCFEADGHRRGPANASRTDRSI